MSDVERAEFSRKLGVAFQGGALFSSMTVGDNIMLPLREHAELDQMTMEIMMRLKLEVVSLAGFEDLMPSELSGGMIKRAAFARAIVMDPQLLFCDEPSAGLATGESHEMAEFLKSLDSEIAILIIEHDLDVIFEVATHISVLHYGKLLTEGPADQIRNDPQVQEIYLGQG